MYNALNAPQRAIQRLVMAIKYYRHLSYSWHLAWVKAGRYPDSKG